ncbi:MULTISPECIES: hypothetical protein [Cyanophyceae]|uniref:hypothetical protein n=1 Tax=Cyanophyceae TaxID=3028117 RepID=UPI001682189E|nr:MULTISPECIES: hypothetical protein [Cyanophyceae]MBD1916086.1 hypothetical protein [Phormidium sp. FACHB-77]MBD2031645.1 hypothetical protein [Phormidium sp. FACHB-322]MBD2052728.1 hypothetical protein [Leptolyngbya sp. FACHB-60]
MEYWEFLLQKEGDQSWLPLDTSQVEILEGRYRVMAHTSHTNTPVYIEIGQLLHDSQSDPSRNRQRSEGDSGTDTRSESVPERFTNRVPPQRRTLRRQGEINENGLMVVMPFTRLGEGTWDIQCASAIAPEANPEDADAPSPWRYAVQLQVVAQDSADEGDWFADDGSAGLGAIAASRLPLAAEAASVPIIELQAAAAAMDAFQSQLAASAQAPWAYGLTLPHAALLGSAGESLGLTATVTGPSDGACPPLTLVLRLSDPQTAVTVAMAPVPLAVAMLPSTMTLTVTVPTQLSTRLLLGEVGLFVGTEIAALQRFTVTVDVASLFDAIANQAETESGLDVVFPAEDLEEGPASPLPPAPDLKTWDIVGRSAPPRQMPILTLPRNSSELPPKIYYPSPHEAAARQPSLPLVGRSRPVPPPSGDRSPDSLSDPATPRPEPVRGLSLPPIASPPQADDSIAILTGQASPSAISKPRDAVPQLMSHEAMGFRDLKLQDRFWNRLNDLAINLQQEAIEQRSEVAAAPLETLVGAPVEPPPFIPFVGEVVIYEDEDPTLRDLEAAAVPVPQTDEPPEMVTPPMPLLELPEGDLIAGEPVVVTLRVPFHPNRLYLKVWITDPQTRTLADEPRQVLNLLPNGQGQLEGNLQLTAPFGCLEAWFEAIAVDMVTQQESYKVSVSRAIAPAGLSPTSLDEFQI